MTTLEKIRTLHRLHAGELPALLVLVPLWLTLLLAFAVVLP